MNVIGIVVPKLLSLVMIFCSSIDIRGKLSLLALWFLKLILDFSSARPGHSGAIYQFTRNFSFETGELVVNGILFVLSLLFLAGTIQMQAWLPMVPGTIAAVRHMIETAQCIKDIILARKRRR